MSEEERKNFEEYLEQVQKCMNRDADPCENFIEYACGGFSIEGFYKNREELTASYKTENMAEYLFESKRLSNRALEKAKNFEKEGVLANKEFIKFCGGVPAFNDNWTAEGFNFAKAAGVLFALQLNVCLSIEIEFNENTKIISLKCAGSRFLCRRLINNALQSLELDEDKLADLNNDWNMYFNNSSFLKGVKNEHIRKTGADIKNDLDIFDFKTYLEIALAMKITDHDIIKIPQEALAFLVYMSELDDKVLANYLTTAAAYVQLSNIITCTKPECSVTPFFFPAVIATVFEKCYSDYEKEKYKYVEETLNQSFENVKSEFPQNIKETSSQLFHPNTEWIFEYIGEHYNEAKICVEYENLQMSPNNFIRNLVNIKNHDFPNPIKFFYLQSYSLEERGINTRFDILELLDFIANHWKKPLVFHFSGKEIENWKEIIHYRDGISPTFDVPFPDELREDARNIGELGDFDYNQVIGSLEAIKYAYNEYKMWMNNNEMVVKWQNEMLSSINLDCNKLFFVSFAQNEICYSNAEKCTAWLTLMNCKDFVEVFKCTPESRMNPKKLS